MVRANILNIHVVIYPIYPFYIFFLYIYSIEKGISRKSDHSYTSPFILHQSSHNIVAIHVSSTFVYLSWNVDKPPLTISLTLNPNSYLKNSVFTTHFSSPLSGVLVSHKCRHTREEIFGTRTTPSSRVLPSTTYLKVRWLTEKNVSLLGFTNLETCTRVPSITRYISRTYIGYVRNFKLGSSSGWTCEGLSSKKVGGGGTCLILDFQTRGPDPCKDMGRRTFGWHGKELTEGPTKGELLSST